MALTSIMSAVSAVFAKKTDVQVFTSSGTWTKPAGAVRVRAMLLGGGGGGGGASHTGAAPAAATAGGSSIFDIYTAGGGGAGGAGATSTPGTGGSGGASPMFRGGNGGANSVHGNYPGVSGDRAPGPGGGSSTGYANNTAPAAGPTGLYGQSHSGKYSSGGSWVSAASGYGAGGGAGVPPGVNDGQGGGGGGGGYISVDIDPATLGTTEAVTVGSAGAGGLQAAGTNAQDGTDGTPGIVIITTYF